MVQRAQILRPILYKNRVFGAYPLTIISVYVKKLNSLMRRFNKRFKAGRRQIISLVNLNREQEEKGGGVSNA